MDGRQETRRSVRYGKPGSRAFIVSWQKGKTRVSSDMAFKEEIGSTV
jgi:hypothetical protein